MTQTDLTDYLARGGKLTSPENVPPRYRAELLRLMASFVDSELAGAAGFADTINDAPGIRNRIAAARITAQKLDHAGRVLALMGEFGADTARYDSRHDWAARLPRDTAPDAARGGADLRLPVFHFPIQGYVDAVTLNVVMGLATEVQLAEMARISYAPLAELIREIAPREAAHVASGVTGLREIVETTEGRIEAERAISYWMPRVETSFGSTDAARFESLSRLGLRHTPTPTLRDNWAARMRETLGPLRLI